MLLCKVTVTDRVSGFCQRSEFSRGRFQISDHIAAYLQRKVDSLKVSKDACKPLGGRVTAMDPLENFPKPLPMIPSLDLGPVAFKICPFVPGF